MSKKNDIIFDIDWQGTKQLSKFKNLKLIKIYLIPPNKNELKERLIKRNQDSKEEVERRYKAFDDDILHWKDYDFTVVNDKIEKCYKQIIYNIKLKIKKKRNLKYNKKFIENHINKLIS